SGAEPGNRQARAVLPRCAPRFTAFDRHGTAAGPRDRVHPGGCGRADRRIVRPRQPDLAVALDLSHGSHARRTRAPGRARRARRFRLLAARALVGALGLTPPAKLEIRELSISFASKPRIHAVDNVSLAVAPGETV